jgi:SAM-dependent methyltransferase
MKMETLAACVLCGGSQIELVDPAAHFSACRACGAVFDSPRPVLEEIVAFYSKPGQYNEWVAAGPERDRLWRRRLAKMRTHAKAGSLLDIGAGIGQFLHHAARVFSKVEGTEVSASAIALAREKFGLTLRPGTAESIDFGGARFDNITLFHVLEHVPAPRELIRLCHGLLNPGGMLFIAVPNDIASLGSLKRRAMRKLGKGGRFGVYGLPPISLDGGMDEIHLTHFTPAVLKGFLEASGFEVAGLSLDPFYAASGPALARYAAVYAACSAFHALTGRNVYGTIWAVARRKA